MQQIKRKPIENDEGRAAKISDAFQKIELRENHCLEYGRSKASTRSMCRRVLLGAELFFIVEKPWGS